MLEVDNVHVHTHTHIQTQISIKTKWMYNVHCKKTDNSIINDSVIIIPCTDL